MYSLLVRFLRFSKSFADHFVQVICNRYQALSAQLIWFKIKYIQIRLNERSLPSCSQFSIPFIFRKSFQIYESLLVGEGRAQATIWLARLYLLWFWADYRKWNENRVASKRHLLDLYLKKSSKIKFWEGLNEWIKLAIVLKVFFFLNRWFPTGNSHFIWFSTLESLRSVFSCNGAHAVS